ncbi:MAG: hypothetical protein HUK06_01175 [Bacteroidaceae bacterium]|nr:hypothetical protein [Bacteroidaceae bacterium]
MLELLLLFLCLPCMAQRVVTVNTDCRLQTVEGWGISLCWWAKEAGTWPEEDVNQLVDWLVSPEGLNYNVFRYNIPGGDDPKHRNCKPDHMKGMKGLRAAMKGFKEDENSPYDWNADEAQIRILRKIVSRCQHYGKRAIIEAFANTPPWWMTVSGCCAGADSPTATNLHPDYYDDYAQYLVDVCQHFRDAEGIEFHSLAPFNEPNTDYWHKGGTQEGCGFLPADQVRFLNDYLAPRLARSCLKTVISASDETNEKKSLETWSVYEEDAAALESVAQWNTHSYGYSPVKSEQSRSQCRTALGNKVRARGKTLWMSETGGGGRGIMGNLGVAKTLFDDMRYLQPSVWCDWQYVDSGNQWCLITCSGNVDGYRPPFKRNKNYFVRAQVTRNITPGYVVVETSDDSVLAAISPDGKTLVVCLLNRSADDERICLNVQGFGRGAMKVKSATVTSRSQNMEELQCDDAKDIVVRGRSIVTIVCSLTP